MLCSWDLVINVTVVVLKLCSSNSKKKTYEVCEAQMLAVENGVTEKVF